MSWQISASTTTTLRLNKELVGFFRNRLKQTADAEDLASTTWLAAGRNYKHLSSLRHFLFAVAYKVLAGHHRRANRRPLTEHAEVDSLPTPAEELETLLSHAARKADINRCTAQLSEAHRDVLQLAIAGHKSDEIAEILQLNPNTVRSRLSRAILQLRHLLAQITRRT